MPKLPRNVRLLGLASLLNDIASEAIFPLLPRLLLGSLGGNRFYLGIIEGLAETVASLLKLFAGAWSDRAGHRKRFIVLGYSLAALARPLTGVVATPWQLLGTRLADRIGKGIRTAPRDALVVESTREDERGRAFGFHRAMDHLGAALGPLAATLFLLIWPDALSALFLLTLLPGLLVVFLLAWGLKETNLSTDRPRPLRLTLRPFSGDFRRFLASLAIFTLGNSSDAFLLVRAGELGVPTAHLPLLWCLFHVLKSAGNLAAGTAVDRLGPRPLLLTGWVLYAFVYLAFALASQSWHAWTLFLIYGAVFALVEPAEKTLVANLVGGEQKGLAFGWMHCVIGLAALPSSLLFGWIYERFGPSAAFGSGGGLACAAALMLTSVRSAQAPCP